MIQVEVSQLVSEIDRIASHAQFNGMNLLTGRFANAELIGGTKTGSMWFHIGANMDQRTQVFIGTMTAAALNMKIQGTGEIISFSAPDSANKAIATMDMAIRKINKQRADLGAYQNRLEHAARGLMVSAENLQAAESVIRDADMANEMVSYTKNSILVRTGTAMLAQANTRPQSVLQLLGA